VKEAAMNAIRKIIPLIDIDKEIPNEVIRPAPAHEGGFRCSP